MKYHQIYDLTWSQLEDCRFADQRAIKYAPRVVLHLEVLVALGAAEPERLAVVANEHHAMALLRFSSLRWKPAYMSIVYKMAGSSPMESLGGPCSTFGAYCLFKQVMLYLLLNSCFAPAFAHLHFCVKPSSNPCFPSSVYRPLNQDIGQCIGLNGDSKGISTMRAHSVVRITLSSCKYAIRTVLILALGPASAWA